MGIAVHIHADDKSWLVYEVSVESPDEIPITAEVGLGQLGTAGIPFTFPIPHAGLISGRAPDLFEQTGEVSIPGAAQMFAARLIEQRRNRGAKAPKHRLHKY